MRAASVVGVVVIALALAGSTGSGRGVTVSPLAPRTAAPTTASASVPPSTATARSSPSPHGYAAYPAVDYPAGTYVTKSFQPAFTAEIDTDLGLFYGGDDTRFVFIGQDKNAPVNADEEWGVMYLDRVLDPVGQRTIEPLVGDPLDWLAHHPRLEVVPGSAADLEVDGHPARQLDLLPVDPVRCGSHHYDLQCVLIGYGPLDDEPFVLFAGSRLRVVVVDFDGTPIVFEYQAADDARYADRSAVFDRWIRSIDFQ